MNGSPPAPGEFAGVGAFLIRDALEADWGGGDDSLLPSARIQGDPI